MTITEVKAEYVFAQLGKGIDIICIDFKRGQYVDMAGLTVQRCQQLVSETDSTKFFNVQS